LWFIGLLTNWMPDVPLTCRLRGFLSAPFLKKCGRNFQYGSHVRFLSPHGIAIGDNVYVAAGCWISGSGKLVLEDEVVVGPYTIIVTAEHRFKNNSVRFGGATFAPVKIGKGSWIGAHSVITAGVTIGRGNLIGANAVVTADTPDNVFAAGVPARVVGERKDNPSEIKSLSE